MTKQIAKTKLPLEKAKQRIASFDLIRGYFIFMILIDHLRRFFGVYEIFTGRGAQWASAAEGFFFVSGIMLGMVRGRKMVNQKFNLVLEKCWSRALKLYFWAIGLSFGFSALAKIFVNNPGLKDIEKVYPDNLSLVKDTLLLKFNYGWADFLGFYAIFLLIAPLAIWMLRKKLWHILLGLSLVVWILGTGMKSDLIVVQSWQILFFGGMIIGFYRKEIEAWISRLQPKVKLCLTKVIYSLSALTLIASVYFTTIAKEYSKSSQFLTNLLNLDWANNFWHQNLEKLFLKSTLPPLRLLVFLLWFSALYMLVNKFELKIKKWLGWLLIEFGQSSLYVYIMHAVLLFGLDLIIPDGQFWLVNFLINTSFVLVIWLMAKRKFLFKVIPR
jgi:hypothetical protein